MIKERLEKNQTQKAKKIFKVVLNKIDLHIIHNEAQDRRQLTCKPTIYN